MPKGHTVKQFAQMRTITGALASFPCHEGTAPVIGARVYRHHGDHSDGIQDSWFVEVTIKLDVKNDAGNTLIATPTATLRSQMEHGIPKRDACNLVANILYSGKVNLIHWMVDHY